MKGHIKLLFWLLIFTLFLTINASAQKSKPKVVKDNEGIKQEVIATIGNEKITYSDVEKAFKKNIARKEVKLNQISKDSLNDFINLYVNYRLKVKDALTRGFDKDSSVVADIEQNRRVLAESFFYDKKLVNPNVDRWLKQCENEMQIAIIMVSFPPNATNDTIESYKKAMRFVSHVKNGTLFEQLARDSSDDKETSKNGGVIATFITAGKVQRYIEDVIFSLKLGEVSPYPIRTRYGYLLIKLLRIEPRFQVYPRHILFTSEKDNETRAKEKADSVLALLKNGHSFAQLAKELSDDKEGSEKGGDLGGWYSRSEGFELSERHLVPEMERAVFSLKDGEISDVIRSSYGYHIVKRDSTREFDKEKEKIELKVMYKKMNFENDKKVFLDSLREVYGFNLNKSAYNKFLEAMDTTKSNLDSQWTKNVTTPLLKEQMFSFKSNQYTVSKFIELMNTRSDLRGLPTNPNGLNRAIDRIVSPLVFEEASKKLESEYPEFSALINEFRDGILLYKVEALEVWDKLKFDSVQAKKYWETVKAKYKTDPTYYLYEIYVLSDSLAKELYKDLKNGKDFETLAKENTQRKDFREKKGYWGKVTTKENKLAKILWEKNLTTNDALLEPFPFEKGFSIVKIQSFEPVREKIFEEAIPDFAPEFQDRMQKQLLDNWLNKMRETYKVSINTKAVEKVIKTLKG